MNVGVLSLPEIEQFPIHRVSRAITFNDIAAETHPGRVRLCNEDSFAYSVGNENTLVVVADGIGGHLYGDVASQITVKSILSAWHRSAFGSNLTSENATQFLCSQIRNANQIVYQMNAEKNLRNPMGTTLLAACFLKDALVMAHLGDSRCYRVRNGRIRQLTYDHSYVSSLVSNHVISRANAAVHPFAHVICRSVGITVDVQPELNFFDRKPGDRYLFCTDGAILSVDENDLQDMLYDSETPQEAVSSIVRTALSNGGEDNITAIVMFT